MRFSSLAVRFHTRMESCAGESRSNSLDLLLVGNKRKPNFTEGESLYLISQFEKNASVLTSKLNDASTNKQKVEVWKRICGDYNSKNPIVLRTANDLKRKWKNMVRAAKKELLETMTPSENGHGEQSVSQRKLSVISQRIVEILRINTTSNCGTSLASPGLENSFDGSFAEDQSEQTLEDDEDCNETKIHQENGLQHVVHVVVGQDVKPSVLPPNDATADQAEDSQQNLNKESQFPRNTETITSTESQAITREAIVQGSSTVNAKSAVPVSVVSVSSIPQVRQMPSISSTSHTSNPGRPHRLFTVPQQKRMLPSSFSHVIKKRRLDDYGQDESFSHLRAEVEKLKKEKLVLEKEKLTLEKEKLMMEKEKLALEIRFLRDQMD